MVAWAVASSSAGSAVDPELGAIAVQHAQHERVAADEDVARQAVARVAEHRRDRTGPGAAGMWHDWQLRCSRGKSLCCHS